VFLILEQVAGQTPGVLLLSKSPLQEGQPLADKIALTVFIATFVITVVLRRLAIAVDWLST
jgi:hypothetical protein